MRIQFGLTGLVDVLLNSAGCHYRYGDIYVQDEKGYNFIPS